MTRYATFEVATPIGPARRVGVALEGGHLLDLNAAYAAILRERVDVSRVSPIAEAVLPPDLCGILATGRVATDAVSEVLDRFGSGRDTALSDRDGSRLLYTDDEVRLLAPIPRPPSLRDASIFEEHIRKSYPDQRVPDDWYELPIYYKGNPAAVVGTGVEVAVPPFTRRLDYEVEFAVVVGRRGRDLTAEEALAHVAGYMVYNDFTARGIQLKEMRLNLGPAKGKDFDDGNVLGPHLVTPEEFDPAAGAAMIARVNGEEWSRGRSDSAYHSVGALVSHISRFETLHIGDVIGSGTVGNGSGVELGRYPEVGDVVEVEVEGLGVVANRLVEAETPHTG